MTEREVREWVAQQKHGMGAAILEANNTLVIRRIKGQKWFVSAKKVRAYALVADQPDVSLVIFRRRRLRGLEPMDSEFADVDELDLILGPGSVCDGNAEQDA